MKRAEAAFLEALIVLFGAIAFMGVKEILWKLFGIERHPAISSDFGANRCKRYHRLFFIAFDNSLLIFKILWRVKPTVEEYWIGILS